MQDPGRSLRIGPGREGEQSVAQLTINRESGLDTRTRFDQVGFVDEDRSFDARFVGAGQHPHQQRLREGRIRGDDAGNGVEIGGQHLGAACVGSFDFVASWQTRFDHPTPSSGGNHTGLIANRKVVVTGAGYADEPLARRCFNNELSAIGGDQQAIGFGTHRHRVRLRWNGVRSPMPVHWQVRRYGLHR